MELIPASHVSENQINQFLEKNTNVAKDSLLQLGYMVQIDDQMEGCFILEAMGEGIFWLKQLYITQAEAGKLPVLLEAILTLAKQQQAKRVYVHSHQPVVNILLEALQFHPQKEKMFVDKYNVDKGNWWAYHVS